MATTPVCDSQDGNDAQFIITSLSNGEVSYYCGGCFAMAGLALAVASLEPEIILNAVGPVHVAQATPPQEEAKPRAARKRPKAEPPEPTAEPPTAQELEEAKAAASDS